MDDRTRAWLPWLASAALVALGLGLQLALLDRPSLPAPGATFEAFALLLAGLGAASGALEPVRHVGLAAPFLAAALGFRTCLAREHFVESEAGTAFLIQSLMAGLVPAFVAGWLRAASLRRRAPAGPTA